MPASIICLAVGWLWLQFCWLGFRLMLKQQALMFKKSILKAMKTKIYNNFTIFFLYIKSLTDTVSTFQKYNYLTAVHQVK